MTGRSGDPGFEAERRRQQRRLREWARTHPPPGPGEDPADPVHVLAIKAPGIPPGARVISLVKWSLAARLAADAIDAGQADEVQDLGPGAMRLAGEYNPQVLPPSVLLRLGVAKGGRWLAWFIPGDPPEPPPAW
jgi:hypothetical protein